MDRSDTRTFIAVLMAAVLIAALGFLNSCGGVGGMPPAPSGFLLSTPTNSSTVVGTTPTLVWTNSVGETYYHVQVSEDLSFVTNYFTWPVAANTTSFTVPVSTLSATTKYYWRIHAVNNAGRTTASNAPFSFMTTYLPPSSSFSLISPINSATGVSVTPTLEWTDAANETDYTVQISTSPTFTTNTFSWPLSANTTSYVVTASTLTMGTQYYWQVLATTSGGPIKADNAPFTFFTP